MLQRTPKRLPDWFEIGALYTFRDGLYCNKQVVLNTVDGDAVMVWKPCVFLVVATAVDNHTGAKFVIFLTQDIKGNSVEVRLMDAISSRSSFDLVKD
jgi:hypothetical protein